MFCVGKVKALGGVVRAHYKGMVVSCEWWKATPAVCGVRPLWCESESCGRWENGNDSVLCKAE